MTPESLSNTWLPVSQSFFLPACLPICCLYAYLPAYLLAYLPAGMPGDRVLVFLSIADLNNGSWLLGRPKLNLMPGRVLESKGVKVNTQRRAVVG